MKGRNRPTVFLFLSLSCIFLYPALVESATVTYQLREEQIKGTFVGNVERDMLTQGELDPRDAINLKYTLSASSNPHATLFTINETTSTIRTSEKIDRESMCPGQKDCEVKLSIAVYRRGEGDAVDLFKVWYAIINIVDMNDNAPTFPQPFVSLSVPESVPPRHVLRTSGAEDRDTGERNSVQDYRLSPPNPLFGLDVVQNLDGSTDLGIVIKEQLDREREEFYQLKVVVTDGGYPQRTGSLTVNITVADINDNRPSFVRGSYNVTVPENVAPNTEVVQVSATDRDLGLNSQVTYRFSARVAQQVTDVFQIDTNTGVISARAALDFEDKQQYQFLVEAKDGGSPQLSGAAMVIVNVQDVNDNAPQININLTPGGNNVTEDEATGKFIAHVSVSDRDSGQNSLVVCSMHDDHFTLQKFYDHAYNMYKVLLSSPLDYESATSHRVEITCRDRGEPQLVNKTSFTVHVRDVNDNAPVFSRPTYTASVMENTLDARDLLQISARDPDTGPAGEVEFALNTSTPNVTRLFSLDPFTGWLRVRSPLNREDHPQYQFHVLAFDRGSPSLTSSAAVVIEVLDENDEKPYFTRPVFQCYVMERQAAGTRVGNLTAIDTDSPQHANMAFSIVQGVGDAALFSVDPRTGVIKSRAVFDREKKDSYRLMVKVEDPGVPLFYDLANVTITVLDDNDNRPVIHYPQDGNNSINVSFAIQERTIILIISATDKDEGVFGQLFFHITDGDPSRLFDLDEHDGSLRLARTILPADVKEYTLQIEVRDGGNPPSVVETELHVNIVTGNLTLMAASAGGDDNIVIVIVLVCVTVVLALAVIITICLIRHIDRERQAKRTAALAKMEDEKMFRLKNQEATFMTILPNSSSGSNESSSTVGTAGRNCSKKKEVSFSLDEGVDSLNTSSGGSANNLSTFKTATDKHKDMPTPAESGMTVQSTPSALTHRPVSEDSHHLHPVQEEGCQYLEMMKRSGEDALSESSGETGTSDSGRGGSEEDSHSNRGSAVIMEPEGPAVYQQHTYPRNSVSPSFVRTDVLPPKTRHYGSRGSFNSTPTPSGRQGRQHSPHVSFSGNLEYLGESSTDHDIDYLPPPPPDILQEPAPAPAPMERNFSSFTSPTSNSYRSVLHSHPGNQYSGYGGVCTSLVKNSNSPSAALSVDGGRPRWGSPSFNDEDDRTTNSTTSGSYILSHDDLPRADMDDRKFNDMIV